MDGEVLIIGAGPAGMTAALQLKRSGLKPILVERDRVGGALLNAGWVENYPGFPEGITGADLVGRFQNHIEKFDIRIHKKSIDNLAYKNGVFLAECKEGNIRCQAVIIASGSIPKRLNVSGEAELLGRYVFHEYRDLPENPGKKVCIIGGGDVAFDYALTLAKRNVNVIIAMRSRRPRCLRLLEERASVNHRIKILSGLEPIEICDTDSDEQVNVRFKNQDLPSVTCNLVLIAIGRSPDNSFISPEIMNRHKTNSLLYFAGDVLNGSFRQVGIAVGDGLRCAMDISAKLINKE